jgi:hypothetical protein
MCRNQRWITTTTEGTPMKHTDLALELAVIASAARPCGGFGHGYQWRTRSAMNVMNVKSINATATKRPARRLGLLTT